MRRRLLTPATADEGTASTPPATATGSWSIDWLSAEAASKQPKTGQPSLGILGQNHRRQFAAANKGTRKR